MGQILFLFRKNKHVLQTHQRQWHCWGLSHPFLTSRGLHEGGFLSCFLSLRFLLAFPCSQSPPLPRVKWNRKDRKVVGCSTKDVTYSLSAALGTDGAVIPTAPWTCWAFAPGKAVLGTCKAGAGRGGSPQKFHSKKQQHMNKSPLVWVLPGSFNSVLCVCKNWIRMVLFFLILFAFWWCPCILNLGKTVTHTQIRSQLCFCKDCWYLN